ncbi:histidine phosphatase family protein [Nocardia ninae]|uniref:phosphoglycerate mutase (2,3-diphosphoglycerate-dependent) n=1 Tax=Nocardia ninae NBRC 108245 TaxID=1210091 RepID=A0A511MPN3_9NOCA|nr:histidine phosphatase family protein [Nocardia ninae]GEM41906.1 phosphoglycerate mutase [Nocardia ninae NBRC 108245]
MTCSHTDNSGSVDLLYAVRHGQSTANVALAAGELIESDDMTIELTELGERQAVAVGRWLVSLDPDQLPDLVLCSPYLRAVQTWQLAEQELRAANRTLPCHRIDQRLYDRSRGQLKHLPRAAVRERFPDEPGKEARDPLGYRPPGGESFKDVAERLRGVVSDLRSEHRHRRVLIVAHDAVVLFLRQILENLTDTAVLALAEEGLAGNGSITGWQRTADGYQLLTYDERTHLPET